jgi:hypothetical protein
MVRSAAEQFEAPSAVMPVLLLLSSVAAAKLAILRSRLSLLLLVAYPPDMLAGLRCIDLRAAVV